MSKLIIIRHGESLWNLENKFAGWKDIDLSDNGIKEAINAGKLINESGIEFDIAYTSVLKRAIKTLWYILDEINQHWIPVYKLFELNERHYGGLTGLNKTETSKIHGDDKVFQWRRSFNIKPPESSKEFHESLIDDRKYFNKSSIPKTESLKDTSIRITPFLNNILIPKLESNNNILISAHGNSIRTIIKEIEKISDEQISNLEIPTGKPILIKYSSKTKEFEKFTYLN
tara:strand:- start:1092 stop:1778 length:687 start_codon:yes stop_codon:yes gene_type:complete